MPDPKVSLPAKVVQRGDKWAVVDADGKQLPGAGDFASKESAHAACDAINEAWHKAKTERRSKGAPEITREARVLARTLSITLQLEEFALPQISAGRMHAKFDPRAHPRDRLGKFAEVLGRLSRAKVGSTVELPHGVVVRKELGRLSVSGPHGKRRPGETWKPFGDRLDHPHAAAAVALREHDKVEIERGTDAMAATHQQIRELGAARQKAMAAGDMSDVVALERVAADARRERGSLRADVLSRDVRPPSARVRRAVTQVDKELASRKAHIARLGKPQPYDEGNVEGLELGRRSLLDGATPESLLQIALRHGPKSGGGERNEGFQAGMRSAALALRDQPPDVAQYAATPERGIRNLEKAFAAARSFHERKKRRELDVIRRLGLIDHPSAA